MAEPGAQSLLPMEVYGAEPSYFTGKLEAVLRFKELPYERLSRPPGRLTRETGVAQVPGLQLGDGGGEAAEPVAQTGQQGAAVLGRDQPPVGAFEQPRPQGRLQGADLVAHGRGCDAELLGRGGQGFQAGGRLEGAQRVQRGERHGEGHPISFIRSRLYLRRKCVNQKA